jgi:hypothetical protein
MKVQQADEIAMDTAAPPTWSLVSSLPPDKCPRLPPPPLATCATLPACAVQLQVPLGGDLVLIDKLVWDLNSPRYTAEVHAAALCRDLGLGWSQFVAIAKSLKNKIEACRQASHQRAQSWLLLAVRATDSRLRLRVLNLCSLWRCLCATFRLLV